MIFYYEQLLMRAGLHSQVSFILFISLVFTDVNDQLFEELFAHKIIK